MQRRNRQIQREDFGKAIDWRRGPTTQTRCLFVAFKKPLEIPSSEISEAEYYLADRTPSGASKMQTSALITVTLKLTRETKNTYRCGRLMKTRR